MLVYTWPSVVKYTTEHIGSRQKYSGAGTKRRSAVSVSSALTVSGSTGVPFDPHWKHAFCGLAITLFAALQQFSITSLCILECTPESSESFTIAIGVALEGAGQERRRKLRKVATGAGGRGLPSQDQTLALQLAEGSNRSGQELRL